MVEKSTWWFCCCSCCRRVMRFVSINVLSWMLLGAYNYICEQRVRVPLICPRFPVDVRKSDQYTFVANYVFRSYSDLCMCTQFIRTDTRPCFGGSCEIRRFLQNYNVSSALHVVLVTESYWFSLHFSWCVSIISEVQNGFWKKKFGVRFSHNCEF